MRLVLHAARRLRAAPLLTAVAVLSLALGIGANAAIASLVEQLLLRPLPVRAPDALVNLAAPGEKQGSTSCTNAGDCTHVFSYPMFRDLERAPATRRVLTGLAAHRSMVANVAASVAGAPTETRRTQAMLVSGGYFPTLGLTPALGRLLGPDDDRAPGAHPVAVLAHAYWATQLGADPTVVGRPLRVNGQSLTVVGVAPAGFAGTTRGVTPAVFVPLTMRARLEPQAGGFDDRRDYWVYLFGRRAPGVAPDAVARALTAVYRPILAEVEAPLQSGLDARALAAFRARAIEVTPGARGQSRLDAELRTPLALLAGVTLAVLCIACANVASLLLARGLARSGELAVRAALGASRRQLALPLLAEALLLAALGGAAGLLVAHVTLRGLAAVLPPDVVTSVSLALDGRVLAVAAVTALVTGLACGLVPAWQGARAGVMTTVRGAAAPVVGGARGAARGRVALATAQVALAMTLLVTAGLFARSLRNVSREALGLTTEHVLAFHLAPERNGRDGRRARALFDEVRTALAALPGVSGVAESLVPLLAGDTWAQNVSVEGWTPRPDEDMNAHFTRVTPGFFGVLGIPLRAGRDFAEADAVGRPRVAIVNEAFVRRFGLGARGAGGAVGRRMALGASDALDVEIVGVVADTKYSGVKEPTQPLFFTPIRQDTTSGAVTFYVRAAGSSEASVDAVVRAIPPLVRRIDPTLPVEGLRLLAAVAREGTSLDRVVGALAVAFAALATGLAAVGLYGVLAHAVARRTREIGIRLALGADARRVERLVLRQVGAMLLVGGGVGATVALGLGHLVRSLLWGVAGHDAASFAVAAAVLAVVGLGAAWMPARRAGRVAPVLALRSE